MKGTLMRIRNALGKAFTADEEDYVVPTEDEYVELSHEGSGGVNDKIKVRPFVLNDFSGVKPILSSLREGYTIALVNLKPLKDKDLVELKRAVNKLKKTTEAISGDIAGFGEEWLVVAPSFVEVHRETRKAMERAKQAQMMDDDADLFRE